MKAELQIRIAWGKINCYVFVMGVSLRIVYFIYTIKATVLLSVFLHYTCLLATVQLEGKVMSTYIYRSHGWITSLLQGCVMTTRFSAITTQKAHNVYLCSSTQYDRHMYVFFPVVYFIASFCFLVFSKYAKLKKLP